MSDIDTSPEALEDETLDAVQGGLASAQGDLDNGRLVCEVGVAVSTSGGDSHDSYANLEVSHLSKPVGRGKSTKPGGGG